MTITERGKPAVKIVWIGPKNEIKWPDFYCEAIDADHSSILCASDSYWDKGIKIG